MSSDVSLHVTYKVANAPVNLYPFPHIYVTDVFPEDFYRELRSHLPPPEFFKNPKALGRVGSGYPDTRFILPLTRDDVQALPEPLRSFWEGLAQWLLGGFGSMVLAKFEQFLSQRFSNTRAMQYHDEAMIVQDYTTYSLGPHTDAPSKVFSFLFYLPADDSLAHLGTSIYVPKNPRFTCQGGPHHKFELFDRMMTMPFLPNTLFAFLKTYNSFHGVEPVQEAGVRRDLLLYDIKVADAPGLSQQQPAAMGKATFASPKFSF